MYKITEIFKRKKKTFSFEFFPPKTEEGMKNLFETCNELKKYADFFSVTYSPDGSSRERTLFVAHEIQKKFKIPVLHHLTCINYDEKTLKEILDEIKSKNILNIMALRGDVRNINLTKNCYSYQLCRFIRHNYQNFFSIGVACYPEGNLICKDRLKNVENLKIKIENGANFAITQLFFNNEDYFSYVKDVEECIKKSIGNERIDFRIIPGIFPISDYQKAIEFCERCGVSIPEKVHKIFKKNEKNGKDREEIKEAAINWTFEQCKELLKNNAPGLHFFTLNKIYPTKEIIEKIYKNFKNL